MNFSIDAKQETSGSSLAVNSKRWARQFELTARPVPSSSQVRIRSPGIRCTSEWRSKVGAGEGFASTFPKSYVIPMKVRPAEGFASTFPKSYVIPMKVRPAELDVGKFLRAALRQRARAVTSLEVKARAAGLLSEHQHITDARLFKRVKKSLGIKSLRVGFGARSQWLWELPGRDDDAREQDAAPRPQLPIDWVEGVARLDPDRPLNDVPRHRWRQFVADFLSSPDSLAELAARLGWDAMALFGCAPKRPLDYSGCAGLLWASLVVRPE